MPKRNRTAYFQGYEAIKRIGTKFDHQYIIGERMNYYVRLTQEKDLAFLSQLIRRIDVTVPFDIIDGVYVPGDVARVKIDGKLVRGEVPKMQADDRYLEFSGEIIGSAGLLRSGDHSREVESLNEIGEKFTGQDVLGRIGISDKDSERLLKMLTDDINKDYAHHLESAPVAAIKEFNRLQSAICSFPQPGDFRQPMYGMLIRCS